MSGALCVMMGGGLPFKVTVPVVALGSGIGVSIETESVTATVTGAAGPFSYLWLKVSGDANVNVNSPSSQTTSFQGTDIPQGEFASAQFVCRVTDTSTGLIEDSNVCAADIFRTPIGGG